MIRNIERVNVYYHKSLVGTLQQTVERVCLFQYSESWIKNGFSINPFSLPLENRIFTAKEDPFQGLFGVFDDSLPDGWGRLLIDRVLRKNGIRPSDVTPLTRLTLVGNSGKGALEYRPDQSEQSGTSIYDLDELCQICKNVYENRSEEYLDQIYQAGGSSGGARPKVYWQSEDGKEWIVKFPCGGDGYHKGSAGKMEYQYMLCARECGIEIPEVRLYPSTLCDGYFASRRFDRNHEGRIHMISAGGALECSYRIPCLDYISLIKLTNILTNQNAKSLEQIYRIMCFNFAAHNTDDHAKNFSFLYDEKEGWVLSPAYDLTYSNSFQDEHMTALNGNGVNPPVEAYKRAANLAGIDQERAIRIKNDIQDKCRSLKQWQKR